MRDAFRQQLLAHGWHDISTHSQKEGFSNALFTDEHSWFKDNNVVLMIDQQEFGQLQSLMSSVCQDCDFWKDKSFSIYLLAHSVDQKLSSSFSSLVAGMAQNLPVHAGIVENKKIVEQYNDVLPDIQSLLSD